MKVTYIIARTLLGLLLLLSSVTYFYFLATHRIPAQTGPAKIYTDGIEMANLMNIAKGVELICGLLFLTGRYNALASVVIFPILINIFLFHIYLLPSGVPVAAGMLLADVFIAYYYRQLFRPLLQGK